jgi:hypothetical protein
MSQFKKGLKYYGDHSLCISVKDVEKFDFVVVVVVDEIDVFVDVVDDEIDGFVYALVEVVLEATEIFQAR